MSDYSYQIHSAKKVIEGVLKPSTEASVLAGTPGCGKTTISQIVISSYLEKFPKANILVLTHGQNLLKNQYLENLRNPNVKIDFSFGELGSNAQVQVGLPHSIKKYPHDSIDLLIVDECHEFYLKKMVQNIILNKKPKHQVLLTGSPAEFNRLKKLGRKFEITYISGEELVRNDIFSSVDLDVISVKYKKNARESIIEMLKHAKRKGQNTDKIMIAVNRISEAQNVAYHMKSIGRKVALSTHKDDINNRVVEAFKRGEYDTLVVVQRGILGFSDNNITGIFDLRCSTSVDISNQIFARVLRKHPQNIRKFYYRCGDSKTKDFEKQEIMLYKIKAMMRKDIFQKYDGTNMTVRRSS